MAWEQKVYLASLVGSRKDKYGVEQNEYSKPRLVMKNHQPVSNGMRYQEFGLDLNSTRRAYIEKSYFMRNPIKLRDKVYLIDGENLGIDLDELVKNETYNCSNANYEVVVIEPSNLRVRVDFKRLNKN